MLSKGRAKEGQNIFGSGSMTGIAISILVKNSDRESLGEINYCDIGSDLTRDEKLDKLKAWVDVDGVGRLGDWLSIKPNADGDWLGQRDYEFSKNILIASKKNNSEPVLFEILSSGVVSGRDSWVYGYSKSALGDRTKEMIDFYNSEIDRYQEHISSTSHPKDAQEFVRNL